MLQQRGCYVRAKRGLEQRERARAMAHDHTACLAGGVVVLVTDNSTLNMSELPPNSDVPNSTFSIALTTTLFSFFFSTSLFTLVLTLLLISAYSLLLMA